MTITLAPRIDTKPTPKAPGMWAYVFNVSALVDHPSWTFTITEGVIDLGGHTYIAKQRVPSEDVAEMLGRKDCDQMNARLGFEGCLFVRTEWMPA